MPTDFNNIVLHEEKVVLFLLPKAANSSIKAALLSRMGYRVPALDEQVGALSLLHNHPAFHFVTPEEVYKHYMSYSRILIYRDPLLRVESYWRDMNDPSTDKYRPGVDFSMFIELVCRPDEEANIHFKSATYLSSYRGKLLANEIARIPTGLENISNFLGLDLQKLNQSDRSVVAPWTEELRARIRERFAKDYTYFGA